MSDLMKLRLASPISRQLVPTYESSHAAPRIRIRRSAPATARSWNEHLFADQDLSCLDDHRDLVASLDLDLDLGHDCAGLDANNLTLELISSADLHDTLLLLLICQRGQAG